MINVKFIYKMDEKMEIKGEKNNAKEKSKRNDRYQLYLKKPKGKIWEHRAKKMQKRRFNPVKEPPR